jgi:hypothetical protein
MPLPFARRRLPQEVHERLHVAAAVAAEQVVEAHITAALEVVAQGADRAPVERLLDAYARIHYLEDGQHRQLRERALAALGRQPAAAWTERELVAPRSPFRRLVRRFRGRVHHDLRQWIERHTARVQLALLDLHMHHALEFVRILDGHRSATEAAEGYAVMMRLRATTAEMVRLKVLIGLPEPGTGSDVEPLRPRTARFPLRIADNGL